MKGVYAMAMATKKNAKNRQVQFEYNIEGAASVFLLGDFNDWNQKKHEMKKNDDGIYRKTLVLSPGTYEYKFLVDGQWKSDPLKELAPMNSFRTMNNVIHVS
jgi:1,4-alpha-glucan branching enzyme